MWKRIDVILKRGSVHGEKFMRFVLYTLIFIGIFSPHALGDTTSFNCQLKDFVILSMEDGKTNRYSGFADSYDVGDTFRIEMTLDESGSIPLVAFNVVAGGKDLGLNIPLSIDPDPLYTGDTVVIGGSGIGYSLSQDFLRINSGAFSELRIWRYYKSDWQGLWTGSDIGQNQQSSYIGTLNCMGASRSIDPFHSELFRLREQLVN